MELARPRRIERLVGKIARRVNEQTKLRIAVLLLLQVRRILDYAILCVCRIRTRPRTSYRRREPS